MSIVLCTTLYILLYLYYNIHDFVFVLNIVFVICIYTVFVCIMLHVFYIGQQMEINILLNLLHHFFIFENN